MQVGEFSTWRDDLHNLNDLEFLVPQVQYLTWLWSLVEVLNATWMGTALDYKAYFVDHGLHLLSRFSKIGCDGGV